MDRYLDRLMLGLAIVGAVNWGLVGLFRFDLVAALLGGRDSLLSRLVYSLVGVAGGYSTRHLIEEPAERLRV